MTGGNHATSLCRVGGAVTVDIVRGGQKAQLKVVLGSRGPRKK